MVFNLQHESSHCLQICRCQVGGDSLWARCNSSYLSCVVRRRRMSQQSRASVGKSGHKPVIDGVPQGSECVFNVHHPSGWQIVLTAGEVHLVAQRTLMFARHCELGEWLRSNLHNFAASAHKLKKIYINICFAVFVWAALHGMNIPHFPASPFKLPLSFLPKNHLLMTGNLASVYSSPRGWEVNWCLRLCKNICATFPRLRPSVREKVNSILS